MPLKEGYDVKLERVEDIGLSNRRLWVYKLKFKRKQKHKEICVDFDGKLSNFSNPGNFDAKSATDNGDFEWKGFRTEEFPVGSDPSNKKTKTLICLKSKDSDGAEIGAGGEIELGFIGPANGKTGSVSFHSTSVMRITDSNRRAWVKIDWGEKSSTEVPMAMAEDGAATLDETESETMLASLDLDQVLEAETATQDTDDILSAPLSTITGLPPDRWALISEATGATNIGELLRNEAVASISSLRKFL